ncbi:MAG: HRDC domain-containing protein [Bacteroidota bacterium]
MTTPMNPSQYVDLQPEATAILQTVSELDRAYGVNYLVRLLRADDRYGWRNESHPEISTFGTLQEQEPEWLRQIILYLSHEAYLEVSDSRYGSLRLTEMGTTYLATPEPMAVRRRQLRVKPYDRMLSQAFRDLRKEFAQKKSIPPFRVFTNYTLDQLVAQKPTNLAELKMVPGFGDYKANLYGPGILKAVERIAEQQKQDAAIKLQKKAQTPAYQSVQVMFLAGMSEAEIAEKRKVLPATIRKTLIDLHTAGKINLSEWIPTVVAAEDLSKGTAWFEKAETSRLKAAYEALGLDYETLKLCRLYVTAYDRREEDLPMAS